MAHAPPIPEDQRGRGPSRPELPDDHLSRHERRAGVVGDQPAQQGQSANTRQNTHRSGKTQDR